MTISESRSKILFAIDVRQVLYELERSIGMCNWFRPGRMDSFIRSFAMLVSDGQGFRSEVKVVEFVRHATDRRTWISDRNREVVDPRMEGAGGGRREPTWLENENSVRWPAAGVLPPFQENFHWYLI